MKKETQERQESLLESEKMTALAQLKSNIALTARRMAQASAVKTDVSAESL